MKMRLSDVIGQNCVSLDQGELVRQRILAPLRAGERVDIDFGGVVILAPPFLNAAVGRLLAEFTPNQLNVLLTVSNLDASGDDLIRRVIENAKEYYSDAARRKALDAVLDDQSQQ